MVTPARRKILAAIRFLEGEAGRSVADYTEVLDAIEAEAVALARPPEGMRLLLASEDLLTDWGTRTERGDLITAEWGEQKPEGWYEPLFTRHSDDNLVAQSADALERVAALTEALEELLDDTQHALHNCPDEDCPVTKAFLVLGRERALAHPDSTGAKP